jgi:hypothetical protein
MYTKLHGATFQKTAFYRIRILYYRLRLKTDTESFSNPLDEIQIHSFKHRVTAPSNCVKHTAGAYLHHNPYWDEKVFNYAWCIFLSKERKMYGDVRKLSLSAFNECSKMWHWKRRFHSASLTGTSDIFHFSLRVTPLEWSKGQIRVTHRASPSLGHRQTLIHTLSFPSLFVRVLSSAFIA